MNMKILDIPLIYYLDSRAVHRMFSENALNQICDYFADIDDLVLVKDSVRELISLTPHDQIDTLNI